jgi:hypothetical protein
MPSADFGWQGVMMIMPPTPMKTEFSNAGTLFKARRIPSFTLALDVTREQLSDMLRLSEARRFKEFHFKTCRKSAWILAGP